MSAIPLLFEDPDVIAVAKPAGLAVIPARGVDPGACLQHQLATVRGERLFVVHRIDRDTSGVVLFARNANAHRALCLAFEQRRVEKAYRAFVAGRLPAPSGRIEAGIHPARRGKSRPGRPGEPGSQAARTDYRVLRTWAAGGAEVAELELLPLTGRHHQIRVHLRSIGCPVLGDDVYGRAAAELLPGSPCPRLALHAARLAVTWSGANEPPRRVEVEAPLPPDLQALGEWLDQGAPPRG